MRLFPPAEASLNARLSIRALRKGHGRDCECPPRQQAPQQRKLLADMCHIETRFRELDKDGSGDVDLDEVKFCFFALFLHPHSAW